MRHRGLAALLLLLVAAFGAPVSHAGDSANGVVASLPGAQVEVRAGQTLRDLTPIHAPAQPAASLAADGPQAQAATADIQVTYNGFSTAARNSFEAAVTVWESLIVSDRIIHVEANWTPLGSGVLGSAGPTNLYIMGDDLIYPAALAEARCDCNINTGFEIEANFNSSFGAWYLGTDGNGPASKYDFLTVVLHELGHGLGFMSSFEVFNRLGYWGFTDQFGFELYPMSFDVHEWSAASGGSKLITYSNGSTALRKQLNDGSVFFGGPNVVAVNGGRARLYAPSPWRQGSSNSHFDEATFGPGTTNALMTPFLANGEVIHDPGPLTLALFRDIGWATAASGSVDATPPSVSLPVVNIANAQVLGATAMLHLSWADATDPSGISSYQLQRKKGAKSWVTVALATPTSTSANVAVTPGKNYRFRLRATDGAGNVGAWVKSPAAALTLAQESSSSIIYSGSWTQAAMTGASGGAVRFALDGGASATMTFNGTSAAFVSTRSPARGIVEVWLDGALVATVDLYAPSTAKRSVVWSTASPLAAGAHTLEVRATGSGNAASSQTRVDVDAFLTWP